MTVRGRALVTGATGFIGAHLSRALAADGWEVHALVRPPPDRVATGIHPVAVPASGDALVDVVGDIAPTVCFHLATRFQPRHEPADIAALVEGNVTFGAQVAEAVSRTGPTPFVNVGTAWQRYEGRAASPTSLYAATKSAFAEVLQYYGQVEGVPIATLELFDTYGPNDTRPKLLNLLLDSARTGATLEMSPGEQLIDLVHVDDVVRALQIVADELLAGRAAGTTFSARADETLTLRALVEIVGEVSGRPVPVRWGARPYRPREMMTRWPAPPRPDGWTPRIPLREGLRALIDGSTV